MKSALITAGYATIFLVNFLIILSCSIKMISNTFKYQHQSDNCYQLLWRVILDHFSNSDAAKLMISHRIITQVCDFCYAAKLDR